MSVLDHALPELVISEQTGEQLDYEAVREMGQARLFQAMLKERDVRLDLLWAKPGAKLLDGGYWYIIRRNEGAPASYWKVEDEDGKPCAPGDRHLAELDRIDAAKHPDAYRQYRKRQDALRAAGEKTSDEMHREFREKLEERLASVYDTRIAVTAAMKARADGQHVTPEGVVLPAWAAPAREMEGAAQPTPAETGETTPSAAQHEGDDVPVSSGEAP